MADTVDLGSTASAWGFESLIAHHFVGHGSSEELRRVIIERND